MKASSAAFLHTDRLPVGLSLAVMLLTILVMSSRLPVLYEIQQRIESLAFDARMRLTLPEARGFDQGASVIAFDSTYPEPERNPADRVLEGLGEPLPSGRYPFR